MFENFGEMLQNLGKLSHFHAFFLRNRPKSGENVVFFGEIRPFSVAKRENSSKYRALLGHYWAYRPNTSKYGAIGHLKQENEAFRPVIRAI